MVVEKLFAQAFGIDQDHAGCNSVDFLINFCVLLLFAFWYLFESGFSNVCFS